MVGEETVPADGGIEGVVVKDRTARYHDGSRSGWAKVKDRSWYERALEVQ